MKRGTAVAVVVMAAGKGTRMKSDLPKVLHRIDGRTLVEHVLDTAGRISPQRTVVIVGHGRDQVRQVLDNYDVEFAVQDPPRGTGHAIMQAERPLSGFVGDVIVLSGDVPLLRSATLQELISTHRTAKAAATVASCDAPNPFGYGRIVRDETGEFVAIVEERDATDEQRKLTEINSGIYCFDARLLFTMLHQTTNDNAKGEYYLTDAIGLLRRAGERAQAAKVAEFSEARGINTPEELREAEKSYLAARR